LSRQNSGSATEITRVKSIAGTIVSGEERLTWAILV